MTEPCPATSSSQLEVKHVESIPKRHLAIQWDGTPEGAEAIVQHISELSGRDTKQTIMSGELVILQGIATYRVRPHDWVLLTAPSYSIGTIYREYFTEWYREVQE